MPATAILDVQGLRRTFGSTEAVAGVDLRVAAGETVALLGPNGAGKSVTGIVTFISCLEATAMCRVARTGTLGAADVPLASRRPSAALRRSQRGPSRP
jgi:ABC-type branched-subunit amino acid transport system ATPase component